MLRLVLDFVLLDEGELAEVVAGVGHETCFGSEKSTVVAAGRPR